MMKPIRFLSVLMIVLVLCCGCQRTVNPEQKGNITEFIIMMLAVSRQCLYAVR